MKSANGPGLPLVRELSTTVCQHDNDNQDNADCAFHSDHFSPRVAAHYSDDSDRSFFIRLATSS